ncbi:MAG TPA: M20/M25/M40 family metallo-hydrolase [Spirochaetota bacterium]|nr:M20/M25/M40 family metallo-hydrolase [Spirochaetota bacterium]HPI22599.1 M20/M25/M40 family metallo-hydrolase [Spirochaetota bacterium]HPU86918.1 M20/M25/M40 family metallo-hydrolase [Spirochaetota bacterium]
MYPINSDRLVRTFVDLASISSPSWKEEGVIAYLTDALGAMGVSCERHPCGDSFNLLASVSGAVKRPSILLSAHMDTVVPCDNVRPVVRGGKIVSDGTTILGADDKAAIAAFLEALASIRERDMKHGPVELLFSCAEEVGLSGIKGFDARVLRSRLGFVFDSSGPVGAIVVAAPYHLSFRLVVKGRAAHAGIEPEKGASAIRALGEIMATIPHGRIDAETTANIGTIAGGRATNIVADEAICALEIRSRSKTKLAAVEARMRAVVDTVAHRHGVKVRVHRSLEYSGFSYRPSDPVVAAARRAIERIGLVPALEASGGGSDTNVLNRAGIPSVALSVGMQKVHTTGECIRIRDLENAARLAMALIDPEQADPAGRSRATTPRNRAASRNRRRR